MHDCILNSIIIPVFGNEKLLHILLSSLLPTLDESCEVIVVDDGLPEMKLNQSLIPENVMYISNSKNVGYSASVNRAIELSKGEYITTINSDIIVHGSWLQETRKAFENASNIGMLGAKLIYPDYGLIMHAGIFFGYNFAFNGFRMSEINDSLVNGFSEVQALCDALATMPRQALLAVGKYNDEYITSVEDLDLCFSFRKLGLANIYNPLIVGYHKTAASLEHRYKFVVGDHKKFFKRWNGQITDDTNTIFQKSTERFLSKNGFLPDQAYIVNLNRKNTAETLERFIALSKIKILSIFDYSEYYKNTPKYVQKISIDLLEILPFNHLNLRYPIVYIVDYYISLEDNNYWSKNRFNNNDIIFDHAFNLFYLRDVVRSISKNDKSI